MAEVLLEGFLALDTPEGFRAELIEREIVVTPPPDGDHEKYISRVVRQVIRRSCTDMDFAGNKGLRLRSGEASPWNHVIPDVTFAAVDLDLFSDPADEDYRQHITLPFGKPLPLPEPFGFELETTEFL
ncbi:hypothetical protein [Streptomyces acidiscabies]|uniref:hypothetical protein n=1 Tax=Streptomyces acidiscabies TaxID=42234 RepID=UPI0038F634BC